MKNFLLSLFFLWALGIVSILLAYFFLDKTISSFIYFHHWREYLSGFLGLKIIIEWPPVVEHLAPILFFVLIFFRKFKIYHSRFCQMIVILSLSVLLTYLLKNDLKWIFSRYWPETWINDNLSWISNQKYGFQWFLGKPFEGTDASGSFPSGHSAIAFASFISIGLFFRKFLWLCILLASLEGFMMIAFDYHFLSDVIAGGCLGATCAILCYAAFSSSFFSSSLSSTFKFQ